MIWQKTSEVSYQEKRPDVLGAFDVLSLCEPVPVHLAATNVPSLL